MIFADVGIFQRSALRSNPRRQPSRLPVPLRPPKARAGTTEDPGAADHAATRAPVRPATPPAPQPRLTLAVRAPGPSLQFYNVKIRPWQEELLLAAAHTIGRAFTLSFRLFGAIIEWYSDMVFRLARFALLVVLLPSSSSADAN